MVGLWENQIVLDLQGPGLLRRQHCRHTSEWRRVEHDDCLREGIGTVYSFNRHWSEPTESCAMDTEKKTQLLLLETLSLFGKQTATSARSKYNMEGSEREVKEVFWKERRQVEVGSRR